MMRERHPGRIVMAPTRIGRVSRFGAKEYTPLALIDYPRLKNDRQEGGRPNGRVFPVCNRVPFA